MAYLTDRKRADGLGSSKTGTEHFWHMQVSSVALAVLIPLFVFTFGRILGAPYPEVLAYFARPFPTIITGLTLVVGLVHFKNGAQVMIEDYAQGTTRKALIIGVTCLSYACMATGLFALIRLAL
jgi:succinate dehydrogenase / fumarate reductase membrane anchor subunit